MCLNGGGGPIILDHVSSSWNQDEGLSFYGAKNVALSYSLSGEGLSPHATAVWFGAPSTASADAAVNLDLHHNLMMSNSHRAPMFRAKSGRYVNNLLYNMRGWAARISGGTMLDVVNSKWKGGPLRPNPTWHEVRATELPQRNSPTGSPSIYLSGNIGWHQSNPAGDQWLMARTVSGDFVNNPESGPIVAARRRSSPLGNPTHPIIAEPVGSIESTILPIVGASRRLDCGGKWVANRDAVDTRLVNAYTSNGGISTLITNESQVGGYPAIAAGTACTDTDHDGMPDAWETSKGLNPNNAADRNAVAASGYTNLEVYLAGTGATSSGDPTPPPSPSLLQ